MKTMIAVAALIFGTALPAAAQMRDGPGRGDWTRGFAMMSEAGRATLTAAMHANAAADQADRSRVGAARDRVLAIVNADRLDTAALRRAMDDERAAASVMKARHQASMVGVFTALSLADRRAFVADARQMRGRVEKRVERGMNKDLPVELRATRPAG